MARVPKASVKLTKDWRVLSTLLDPSRAHRDIERQMRRATGVNARLAVGRIRKELQRRMSPPNRALTLFIKAPRNKPGVDHAELFKAITTDVQSPWRAEVGVAKGDAMANTAVIVHEGTRIPVTDSMRGLFAALANASRDGDPSHLTGRALELWKRRPAEGWKGLRASTTHIKIPPRRYIAEAIDDKDLRMTIGRNWAEAYAAGIAGVRANLKTRL